MKAVPEIKTILRRQWIASFVYLLLVGGILLLGSGQLNWIRAWLYILFYGLASVMNILILARHDPALLIERSEMPPDTPTWDRILVVFVSRVGPLTLWIVCALDARWRWSPIQPDWTALAGLAGMLLGSVLSTWAMLSNPFFSGVVRIQTERGHTVAQGGPYRWVRHPGYVGFILYYLGLPLLLDSWWGLSVSILTNAAIILRTILEDRMLQYQLPGYAAYTQRVRWRLLPGVW